MEKKQEFPENSVKVLEKGLRNSVIKIIIINLAILTAEPAQIIVLIFASRNKI